MQLALAQAVPSVSVLTNRYNNQRDGLNASEAILTTANVKSTSFGKLFAAQLDGNAFAQPLYVPGVSINGGIHNVVYVATENDSVYALDADTSGAPLWKANFLDPDNGITTVSANDVSLKNALPGCVDVKPQYGITGTPVIDPNTNTIYVVANTSDNGIQNYRLHALDITTGQEKFGGPVLIQASIPGTGTDNDGNGNVLFDGTQELQRPGLLLVNGVVYIAFGSHCDLTPWHGWMLGYSASTLSQLYVYNTTRNGDESAIWMSGTGPASDQSGDIYLSTGNGSFDAALSPPVNVGNSLLRLGVRNGSFGMVDYFVPSNQATLNAADYDLGSGGIALLPDQATGPAHLMVSAGKNGTIYLNNRDSLGHYDAATDHVLQKIPSPNPNTNLNWSTPAFWNGRMYVIMSKDIPRSYTLNNGSLTAASQGTHTFAFLGGQPVISANGNSNGILWTIEHKGSQRTTGAALLHAWDALDLTKELYNSDQNGATDVPGLGIKFSVPTIANGKVYVGTQTELDVYGITATGTPTPTPTSTSTAAATATAARTPTVTPTTTRTATAIPTPTTVPTATSVSTAVTITAPLNGANVGGTVPITVVKGVGVSWVNVYVDGLYFASTPPATFNWNSSTVANGPHTISANAYSTSSVLLGTASVTVNVGPPPSPTATPTATATPLSSITFVGAGPLADSNVAVTSVNVGLPTGVQAGDTLLAQIIIADGAGTVVPTAPSGFTSIRHDAVTSGALKATSWLFARIAGASEPASFPFTLSSNFAAGVMGAWRGATGLLDGTSGAVASGLTVTTVSAPSLTPTVDGELQVFFYGAQSNVAPTLTPSGVLNPRFNTKSSKEGFTLAFADLAAPFANNPSATYPATATDTVASVMTGQALLLIPGAPVATPVPTPTATTTATATGTPTALATPTATASAAPSTTATSTATVAATATSTATTAATATKTPTATPTTAPTATATATTVPTTTATATQAATPTVTPTIAATATRTATTTPTATVAATATSTAVPSATPTSGAVTITTPAHNATVAGTVPITIVKTAAVSWVNVYIDGGYFASTPPLVFNWNSATVPDGVHQISAVAYAANAAVLGSDSFNVTVANAGVTPTATPVPTSTATPVSTPTAVGTGSPTAVQTPTATPTPAAVVFLTEPPDGSIVSGTAVAISVDKVVGVSWVNVYIDGEYFASTPPLTFLWDSTTVPNGVHTISATAYAPAGTLLGGTSLTVTVAN